MLVNFSDDNRQPWTTDFISTLWNGPARSVQDFYARSSFGQENLSADVFGWFTIAAPTTECGFWGTNSALADAVATASGVDLSQYTNRAYIVPFTSQCHFTGTGDNPGSRTWFNINPATCTPADCSQQFQPFPHEIGHNFGLAHAHSLICTSGGVHVVLSDTCTTNEYGDQFNAMGCCQPSLLSNVDRLKLGYIPAPQMVTITASGTYTITGAYSAASSVFRVADGTGQFLYFENRAQQSAYDPGSEGGVWPNGNLLIRRAPDLPGIIGASLLDGSPADNDSIPNAKGMPVGSSFSFGALTVTNVSWDGTNNVVQVTL